MKQAEDYIRLATAAIRFARDREELLKWWEAEKANREVNGVIGVYERRLVEACKHHLAVIAERATPTELLPVRAKRR